MRKAICLFAVLPLILPAQNGISGFAGTWKEDVSRTVTKPSHQFATFTRTAEGNLTLTQPNGKEFTFALDGQPHPDPRIPGAMVAFRSPSDSTLTSVVTKYGQLDREGTHTVSAGGKTLTSISHTRMPDGKFFTDTAVWKRVSGEASGVWGRWQLLSVKSDVPDILFLSIPDTDTISMSLNKLPFRFTAKMDGKDYPATAPNTSSKITVSVSQINNSTLVETLKMDGKPVQEFTLMLSPDGRTLTEEDREPGGTTVELKQVYERQ